MTIQRMDNIGIVVESLDNALSFFTELGLKLEGRAMVEGEWAGRVTGLGDQRVEIAMMVTPDGHSRLELSRFLAPPVIAEVLLSTEMTRAREVLLRGLEVGGNEGLVLKVG